jgi:hypothetical protein
MCSAVRRATLTLVACLAAHLASATSPVVHRIAHFGPSTRNQALVAPKAAHTVAAYQDALRQRAVRVKAAGSTPSPFNTSIAWSEMGPDDIGDRTC